MRELVPMPININEDLAKLWASLFWQARMFVKDQKLQFSPTVNLKIFVKDTYSWLSYDLVTPYRDMKLNQRWLR